MKKFSNIAILGIVVVTLIIGAAFGPQINQFMTGILGGSVGPWDPPAEGVSPQKFTLSKRGTTTAVETADVYAWYDWNGNGMVDLGAHPEGEIETLSSAATSGLVETALEYPVGEDILYQVHKTGYEVETFSRKRTSIPAAHDGSALVVPTCYLTLTDTGATRISLNGELLVTASTDYNWSLSGAEPQAEVVHTATTTDAGINEQAFTHWSTGKVYAGTYLGLIMINQDFIDLKPDGFSGVFVGASNTFVWYFVDGYFNDADVTGDERYSMFHNLDISADGDYAIIGLYNGCEVSDLEIGAWETVLGTSETNIDVDDGL